jgi:hypothetical protein
MRIEVSGSRDGQPWPKRGETIEVSDIEGAGLCASGLAQPIAVTDDVETRTAPSGDVEKRPAPAGGVETRNLTTENAEAVMPGAVEPERKPAPAKKAAVKRAPAKPAGDK